METRNVTIYSYSHPEVEGLISTLNAHLNEDFAPLEGKQDGLREQTITETEFKVRVLDYVKSTVQMSIDKVRHLLLPSSAFFNAKEAEELAKQKCTTKQFEINEKEQALIQLKRKEKNYTTDPFKKKYGRYLFAVALVVGVADGCLAYGSFRQASYPIFLAITAAAAIAAVISAAHYAYCPWIKKAPTEFRKKIRVATVLGIAFIFFSFISHLRVEAAAQVVDISTGSDVLVQSVPHISQWAVCFISLTLFAAVFFMSLLLWKSKDERVKDAEHDALCDQIQQGEDQIQKLKEDIIGIRNKVQEDKRQARDCYDYTSKAIERMRHIGENAIAIYKQIYAKYHNGVPVFFQESSQLVYEESFAFINPQTQLV